MKINYVPGLALRLFPGLSRLNFDAVDEYIATGAKIAIFTGTAPTEQDIWDLSNFESYCTTNASTLVYKETTQLQFKYEGLKHKRVIQRYPVDSTNLTTLCDFQAQDAEAIAAGHIETSNSLYALVYCPDKDTTLNTAGNDLVFFLPDVGSTPTSNVSLSKTTFVTGDQIYLRNLTVSLFQGYQITDTLITGEVQDPHNSSQTTTGIVGSKKSIYINKVWGGRLSEAYRDCFISRATPEKFKVMSVSGTLQTMDTTPLVFTMANVLGGRCTTYYSSNDQATTTGLSYYYCLRKYNNVTGLWENSILHSEQTKIVYGGYLVNESMLNLLDEINNKAIGGQLSKMSVIGASGVTLVNLTAAHRFTYVNGEGSIMQDSFTDHLGRTASTADQQDLLPNLLAQYILTQSHVSTNIKNSITKLLIEQGFDESMVNSAIRSVQPIDFNLTKYSSSYNPTTGYLTIQNSSPAKLKSRYKKSIQNPSNEQMYILLPRYLSRVTLENNTYVSAYALGDWDANSALMQSCASVSYPQTQKVIDGEVIDTFSQRVRQQDYTAISIGTTGNGNTDLEYDLLDIIDYIDSFTTMIKIPNKF